jgi:hypothetical protein
MIKFFRKIRFDLMEKNKTGKPAWPAGRYLKYAIGEIILVVIGILIALQINNWNEKRKENNYEQKILNELKSDYLYNKQELHNNIKQASDLAINADSLIIILGSPINEVDFDKFWFFTRNLFGYSTFDPSNGALNNLLSSGNLNIIKSDSLRMHLSKWSGMVEDVKEDEKRLIYYGDTWLEPIFVENYYPNSGSTEINMNLMGNHPFENIVKTMRGRANYIVLNYKILDSEIDSIIDDINGELRSDQK